MGQYGNATGIVMLIEGGVGKLLGLNDGDVQAYFDSDGKIKWAGGKGVLDAGGFAYTETANDYVKVETAGAALLDVISEGRTYAIRVVNYNLGAPAYAIYAETSNRGAAIYAVVSGTPAVDAVAAVYGQAALNLTGHTSYGVHGKARYVGAGVYAEATGGAWALQVSGGNVDGGSRRYTNLADATAATDALNRQTGDGRFCLLSTGYLKADGSVPGATGAALQQFTAGVLTPVVRVLADGTAALQVQNAAGTTPLINVDTTNLRIGLGTSTPGNIDADAKVDLRRSGNAFYSAVAYGGTPGFFTVQAGGTEALPTATVDDATLLFIGARGRGATGFPNASRGGIGIYADENWTDAAQGTRLGFWTTTNGAVARSEKMRLTNAGYLGISTTAPAFPLDVSGIARATGYIGAYLAPNADSTTAVRVYKADRSTVVATFDTTNKYLGLGRDPSYVLDIEGTSGANAVINIRNPYSEPTWQAEILTNPDFTTDLSGWTAGAGWAWDAANGGEALHTAGNTATLEQNVAILGGAAYAVVITVAGYTAGSVALTIGGVAVPYYGTLGFSGNTTFRRLFVVAASTGTVAFAFTPTSNFAGALTSVSFKAVNAWATPQIQGMDATSNTPLQIRASQTSASLSIGALAGIRTIGGAAQFNTLLGVAAGAYIGGGYRNVAVGYGALTGGTGGSANPIACVAVGYDTLYRATSALNCTVIGDSAGQFLYSAVNVTLIGSSAAFAATTPGNVVGVGTGVLYGLTTGTGLVAVGDSGGRTVTTATNSVFLGYNAGYNASQLANGDNMVAIGYNAYCDKSNQVVLGNASITETLLRGNVGVGTTLPTAVADIGASTTLRASLRVRSGTAPTTPNDGDLWYDGTNLKFRDGTGTTRTLSWT